MLPHYLYDTPAFQLLNRAGLQAHYLYAMRGALLVRFVEETGVCEDVFFAGHLLNTLSVPCQLQSVQALI